MHGKMSDRAGDTLLGKALIYFLFSVGKGWFRPCFSYINSNHFFETAKSWLYCPNDCEAQKIFWR
jgi:hypothetical protein